MKANLEENKARLTEINNNPNRTWTASIGKLSIFSEDYVAETMTGFMESPTGQIEKDTDRMEREVLSPMREDRADIPEQS